VQVKFLGRFCGRMQEGESGRKRVNLEPHHQNAEGARWECVEISVNDGRHSIDHLCDLLRQGRVGTHRIDYFPGEVEAAEAYVKADLLMRLLLPPPGGGLPAGLALAAAVSPRHPMVSLPQNGFTPELDHLRAQSVGVH
jgi:hypothetical protein